MSELAERLGHSSDARLLIVSCDDLGSCHAANLGVLDALRTGAATCASIMVPAPWARHATELLEPGDDIGVHLTLNAEHDIYRWGPITHAPSLLSGEGGFPRNTADLWEHADLDEVRRELRAPVNRALAWGVDVTHLAPHLSAITLRPEFFDVYLELATEFTLPIRLPSTVTEAEAGFPTDGSPRRRVSSSRITSITTGEQARGIACFAPSPSSLPGSPKCTFSQWSTRRRCARSRLRLRRGLTTTGSPSMGRSPMP